MAYPSDPVETRGTQKPHSIQELAATVGEAIRVKRDDHHARCNSRHGQECDCYNRFVVPYYEALDGLVEQYEDALRQGLVIKERVNELEEQYQTARDIIAAFLTVTKRPGVSEAEVTDPLYEVRGHARDFLRASSPASMRHDSASTTEGGE